MLKLFFSLLLALFASVSYAKEEIDKTTKINLPFVGIDINMPNILLDNKSRYVSHQSKDKFFSYETYFMKKRYKNLIDNINKERGFFNKITESSNEYDYENDFEYFFSRIFKVEKDGYVLAAFRIDKKAPKIDIEKYMQMSKNALESISFSKQRIDLTAGFPFEINLSESQSVVHSRFIDAINLQKNTDPKLVVGIVIHTKPTSVIDYKYPLDYNSHDCKKKIATIESAREVAGIKAQVQKVSQICSDVGEHITTSVYETSLKINDAFSVISYKFNGKKTTNSWDFYQSILNNIELKK